MIIQTDNQCITIMSDVCNFALPWYWMSVYSYDAYTKQVTISIVTSYVNTYTFILSKGYSFEAHNCITGIVVGTKQLYSYY